MDKSYFIKQSLKDNNVAYWRSKTITGD